MGFLDKLRGKKEQVKDTVMKDEQTSTDKATTTGRRIQRYTSEGKPVYD